MTHAKSSSSIPTELLYIGAAGEHYIMSECFRHNMEAFKLPIDKGFDLVVTRAYRHLSRLDDAPKPVDRNAPETPIYVQVKSRQAAPIAPPKQKGERPSWEGYFSIKPADLALICATPNSALACVLFVDTRGELMRSRTAYAWWMSSAYVSKMCDAGHFIAMPNKDTLELWVRYVEPAPDSEFNQNTYVSFFKQCQIKGAAPGKKSSGFLLSAERFDFGKLGME
ncbi:hypothetical protein WT60_23165 [Burkholderia sp. MSMB617WGS]|uniref:hypothetical protein n=1 Tax=Burkholderia sp. MSMB617WGS TaxID=1637831 RepID=UPI00075FBB5E|nr:hypothetical protein [Burkholderia sp. MSMB617WGS]AOK49784.1 hypothetical protein WT60_23165 [Burkholderia sp. MSMB617WGS]